MTTTLIIESLRQKINWYKSWQQSFLMNLARMTEIMMSCLMTWLSWIWNKAEGFSAEGLSTLVYEARKVKNWWCNWTGHWERGSSSCCFTPVLLTIKKKLREYSLLVRRDCVSCSTSPDGYFYLWGMKMNHKRILALCLRNENTRSCQYNGWCWK